MAVEDPQIPIARLCACGCGEPVSGKPYRNRRGEWTVAQFKKNHHTDRGKKITGVRKPRASGYFPWIHEINQRLRARRQSFAWLADRTDLPYQAFAYKNPSRVTALKIAKVLGMKPSFALKVAGWPEPSALGWKILDLMVAGESIQDIADRAHVHRNLISECLNEPDKHLSQANLRRLAPVLGLTSEESVTYKARIGGARSPESYVRMVQTRKTTDPDAYKKAGSAGGRTTWKRHPVQAEQIAKRASQLGARARRRPHILKEGRRLGIGAIQSKGEQRRQAYVQMFNDYAAKGLNPKAPHYWRQICNSVGGSKTTAEHAYREWLALGNSS